MRSSGILLHISSLPSEYGIGTLGKGAYEFVDYLSDCGLGYWQVLPIGPTGYGDSPYQTFSTFAGNSYFIDPYILYEDGLVEQEDLDKVKAENGPVDYGALYNNRPGLFRKAFLSFTSLGEGHDLSREFAEFCRANAFWLDDYSLFMALHERFGCGLNDWPEEFHLIGSEAVRKYASECSDDVMYNRFIQFLFFRQWNALKSYANEKGIKLIGDIPFYISIDSRDVWANKGLFELDSKGHPLHVAGVPPDAFSRTGQLWGNPVYLWDAHRREGFDWWKKRIYHSLSLFDAIRIDHFRGFESFYSIPVGDVDATGGEWMPSPGIELFDALGIRNDQGLRLIAEDIGVITDPVRELLRHTGYPGMKILQFAFDSDLANNDGTYLPHSIGKNSICYTGTHDNMTTLQWWDSLSEDDQAFVLEYTGWDSAENFCDKFISLAYSTQAELVIIPMQDWLEVGEEGRMNRPSTESGNWQWRLSEEWLDDALKDRIIRKTMVYMRDRFEK